jgi:hypothetical protein
MPAYHLQKVCVWEHLDRKQPSSQSNEVWNDVAAGYGWGALEAQITNLRNQRDELYQEMWDKVKRVRNGVKANYGDDSSQYEMVSGTRLSERKSPTRKAKA